MYFDEHDAIEKARQLEDDAMSAKMVKMVSPVIALSIPALIAIYFISGGSVYVAAGGLIAVGVIGVMIAQDVRKAFRHWLREAKEWLQSFS